MHVNLPAGKTHAIQLPKNQEEVLTVVESVCPLTGVVVFCTVAQLLLFPHDELRQREPVWHLHCTILQPLEDQVIHGVADWRQENTWVKLWKQLVKKKVKQQNKKKEIQCLQLSSCIVQVWTSIGKFFRSIGQDRMRVNLRCETRSYSEIQQADYTNECIWRNIFIKPWTSGLTISVLCASFSCVIASNTQYHVGFPPAGSYHTFITATYCLCDSLWSAVLSLCHFSQRMERAAGHLSSLLLTHSASTPEHRSASSRSPLKWA